MDYVTADLWSPNRPAMPIGKRPWLVLHEGHGIVLLSPNTLELVRLSVEQYEQLGADPEPFNPLRVAERLRANRHFAEKYGYITTGGVALLCALEQLDGLIAAEQQLALAA